MKQFIKWYFWFLVFYGVGVGIPILFCYIYDWDRATLAFCMACVLMALHCSNLAKGVSQ